MWAPVVRQLALRHRVVVPDVPGLGESAPLARLDAQSFTRWLSGVIEQRGLEHPVVVAHSLIGSLVARCASRSERLIGRLVLYAAPAAGPYRMPLSLRYVAIRFAVRPTAPNAERFQRFALLDVEATRAHDPGWFEAFDAYTRARAREPHVKRTMRQLVARETKPIPDSELARIDVPTVLLWGRHDRMVPLGIAETASARHRWPLRVVERSAHAPHIEQPEAFVEALSGITTAR